MLENAGREMVRIRPRAEEHYVSQSRSVLVTGTNGFCNGGKEGLRIYQTRSLSRYRYLVDGQEPRPVTLSAVRESDWLGYYIVAPPGKDAKPTKQTVELRLSRFLGHGFHEEIDFTNYTGESVSFVLHLEADADFVDQNEAGEEKRRAVGECAREWRQRDGKWELFFDFHAGHAYNHQGESGVASFHQSIAVRVEHSPEPPAFADGRISFAVRLEPRGTWHACINVVPWVGEKVLEPLYGCRAFRSGLNPFERKRETLLEVEFSRWNTPDSQTLSGTVMRTIARARRDLASLRLHDLDLDHGWLPAAGIPEYLAIYGRDCLTTAWQTSLLGSSMLRGVLPVLASLQGRENNPWRDEEPGKMIHQASSGPLPELNYDPFARYYGSLTTSALYPLAVATLWQVTGDRELVQPFIEPALKALEWHNTGGDLDGDGFSEYLRRSEGGVKNQGWKDSPDAIVHEDGSQVEPPIAPCEEQGFLYIARLRMAELLWWTGDQQQARRLFHQASELKKRFNELFWMEDRGFFCLGLDGRKRQIRSIASNAGHLLGTAIVDDSLARRTADRLMAADMFSGWGVRTLSTYNPAYNPFDYQLGSVWPVENGTFALGMFRFGLHHYVERICRVQFEAAALFQHYRLPEVFSGHPRDEEHPFPALYPASNWPQAWSAAAVFCYLDALLGLFPYAPAHVLFVDPHLPEWLPEISVSNLRVGDATIGIRFWRKPDGSSDYRIQDLRGKLRVLRQPSPWSLSATLGERFQDALLSFAPSR